MLSSSQQHNSIPLISLTQQTQPKFTINPKALQLIQSQTNPSSQMTFISICGDYRSGKSFLMNSLFFSRQGFKVSPTTKPCTKGINISTKPITHNGKNIWILDTEGFGAIDRDDSYDVKIFLLTTLISNVLMYNSFGALDQNTINKFAAICHKAQALDPTINKIRMFWILRDFSLTIQNRQGLVLSSDQYLENALDDALGLSGEREAIKRVFEERHCVTLVRPVIDQQVLSRVNDIKFQQLRGQFVQQIYKLRKKLLSCSESKVIQGVKVNGDNLQLFLSKYIDVLNNNQVETDIASTWQKIVEYQREKQETKVKHNIREFVAKETDNLPLSIQNIERLVAQSGRFLQIQMRQFMRHFSEQKIVREAQTQMRKYLDGLIDQVGEKSLSILKNQQKQTLKTMFQNIQKAWGNQIQMDAHSTQRFIDKVFKTKEEYWVRFQKFLEEGKNIKDKQLGDRSHNKQSDNTTTHKHIVESIAQSSQLLYYEHFYYQQRVIMPKVIGEFSQQLAVTLAKLNQTKRSLRTKQTQLKSTIQQKERLQQHVSQLQKQIKKLSISLTATQKQLSIREHQLSMLTTSSQNQFMKIKCQYQENIEQLKQTILNLEKDFLSVKKQNQLQLIQHQDKVKYLEERNQLLVNKIQLAQKMGEKSIQQLKEQHEEKVKKMQVRYQQLQSQLNLQRKKFLQLNKSKKQQESQLLEDLAQKNEKLLQLRRQFVNVDYLYKEQLQSILRENQSSLQQEFTLQMEEKQHIITVLQQKLQQYLIKINEMEEIENKYQTLLMEHRLLSEEHLNVVGKFKEVAGKLKRSQKQQKEKDNQIQGKDQIIEEIKLNHIKQLQTKEELLKKLKLQLRNTENQNNNQINHIQSKHTEEISQLREIQQKQYQGKLNQKLSQLQSKNKTEKSQLLQQLKDSYNQIETLKTIKHKLQTEHIFVHDLVNKLLREFEITQKDIKKIMRKYKKLEKSRKIQRENQEKQQGDNNQQRSKQQLNQNQSHNVDSQIQSSSSIVQQFSMEGTIQPQQVQLEQIQRFQLQSRMNKSMFTIRQPLQQLQSEFIQLLQSSRSQTEQLEDLKNSFKETISQLEECQTHINNLNTQIASYDTKQKSLEQSLIQLCQVKKQLLQKSQRVQSVQKKCQLLKNQVQVRDEIYTKRESSIRQNLQLYKETIANLTEENQHLAERCSRLQIQLNRFTEWQGDWVNSKSKTNLGSQQNMPEPHQQPNDIYSLGQKINKLSRQNRKLRKQLNHQKQLTLTQNHNPKSPNTLTSLLVDNSNAQLQSLKKENQMYQKRLEDLRARELKLLEEVKNVKNSEKLTAQNKVALVREEFQVYRRKAKEEIVNMEKRVNQLTQEKYKLRQEMLVIRQDRTNYSQIREPSQKNQTAEKPSISRHITPTSHQSSQTQSLNSTISSLKQENTRLTSQLASLNQQLLKLKDQSDKKLASQQLLYQEQVRQLQSEKDRVDLENSKNKTKYQHLLKVNNDLIMELDTFKARANNQPTLKEKYKNKISALFNDD